MAEIKTDKAVLTERQERFCIAYALSGNAAKSAREAGYEEEVAKQQGWENLTKPYLVKRISEIRIEYELKGEISGEWVIAKLRENLDRAMQGEKVLDNRGVPTGEWKYDGRTATKCLELLGKTIALFIDRTQDSKPIEEIADKIAEQWKAMNKS